MVSDRFLVNSDAGRMAAAQYVAENYTRQSGLSRHDALRVSLLVEETLGMVKGMLRDFYGQLWFEGDDRQCSIHLEATADIDSDRKHELLSMSTSGRNAAAKGFMGMLGDVISSALHNYGDAMSVAYGCGPAQYGVVMPGVPATMDCCDIMPVWTLQQYRSNLEGEQSDDLERVAALENLEKSIVANLADDIIVGVKGDRIELIIKKTFH